MHLILNTYCHVIMVPASYNLHGLNESGGGQTSRFALSATSLRGSQLA